MANQTRKLGPLSLRGEVAKTDAEKRTAEVVFSTGARVLRSDFMGSFYEELSMDPAHVRMDRLNNGAPLLADHRGEINSVMGVVESARIENGQGIATVRFASAGINPEADKLFALVRDGVVQNISVGYRTYKAEKLTGGDPKVPTYRATDWQPFEISAVACGADDQAGFRSDEQSNPCVFVTHEKERHVDLEDQKRLDAEKAALEARALEVKHAQEAAIKAERERVSFIQTAFRKAGLPKLAQRAIDNGDNLDAVKETIINAIYERTSKVEIQGQSPSDVKVGEESHEKWQRGAVGALIHRAGLASLVAAGAASKIHDVKRAFKGFDVDEDGGSMRGLTMSELARESLERRGVKTSGMDKLRMVGEAFTYGRAAGQSTASDFSVVLENVMYKTLLGAYSQASDTWRRFCKTDTVQDFRPSNRYRTGSFGTLDLMPESSEYKTKPIPDGLKSSISVQTYGDMIALTRQAIINDDMGALTETSNKFGRMAGLSIEKAVYALLAQNSGLGPTMADGYALFDAAHGNISTGAALSMAALEADRVLMASQKDISNNEYLDLRPRSLLVPIGLGGEANRINRAKYDPTAGGAFESPNIVGGLFSDVIDTPRISGTRRYLFADPDEASALIVAFLNGVQVPFMDQNSGWRIDGTEWKIRLDFGVQAFDPKGAITNAGA